MIEILLKKLQKNCQKLGSYGKLSNAQIELVKSVMAEYAAYACMDSNVSEEAFDIINEKE